MTKINVEFYHGGYVVVPGGEQILCFCPSILVLVILARVRLTGQNASGADLGKGSTCYRDKTACVSHFNDNSSKGNGQVV
jgi:hypothetical protein